MAVDVTVYENGAHPSPFDEENLRDSKKGTYLLVGWNSFSFTDWPIEIRTVTFCIKAKSLLPFDHSTSMNALYTVTRKYFVNIYFR